MSYLTSDINQETARPVLSEILGEMAPKEFFDRHWSRRPLRMRLGKAKLQALLGGEFTPEDMRKFALETELTRRPGEHIHAVPGKEFRDRGARNFEISVVQMKAFHAAGMTMVAFVREPRITNLAYNLKRELRHAGPVTTAASWSPREEGLYLHFDPLDTFVFQTEGVKHWWVGREPVIPCPKTSARVTDEGALLYSKAGYVPQDWELPELVNTEAIDMVSLEPGDVLYVPAGVLHRTAADGDSLSFMISFSPDTMIPILMRALNDVLLHRPEWRHVPVAMGGDSPMPESVREFFAERIGDLRQVLREMDPAGPEMLAGWTTDLQDPGRQFGPPLRRA